MNFFTQLRNAATLPVTIFKKRDDTPWLQGTDRNLMEALIGTENSHDLHAKFFKREQAADANAAASNPFAGLGNTFQTPSAQPLTLPNQSPQIQAQLNLLQLLNKQ